MPHRVNLWVPALLAGLLAAAAVLGSHWVASAASGCIEKPNLKVSQAGHWYYHVDRVLHRRCWFFEASEAPVSPASSVDQVPPPGADLEESWFSRFTAGLTRTFSLEPQQNNISAFSSEPPQNTIPDSSNTVIKITPSKRPKSSKIAKREPLRIAPPPTTNGLASAERHDQLPSQRIAEKDKKHTPQLTAEQQALFGDFLKWYMDKGVFSSP
jgi:hypothetical protein